MLAWLKKSWPQPIVIPKRDYWLSPLGFFLGLAITEFISRHLLGGSNPWFIAPMGASALLLFVLPASPLAQPWSIIGGNLIAAIVGVACAKLLGSAAWAACLAGAISVIGMMRLRCLHPPSGAVALIPILGGIEMTQLGYNFVLFPVLLNSVLLVLTAIVFNKLVRRNYPHQAPTPSVTPLVFDALITRADIDAALKKNQELLDISEEDIESIILQAELIAKSRKSN